MKLSAHAQTLKAQINHQEQKGTRSSTRKQRFGQCFLGYILTRKWLSELQKVFFGKMLRSKRVKNWPAEWEVVCKVSSPSYCPCLKEACLAPYHHEDEDDELCFIPCSYTTVTELSFSYFNLYIKVSEVLNTFYNIMLVPYVAAKKSSSILADYRAEDQRRKKKHLNRVKVWTMFSVVLFTVNNCFLLCAETQGSSQQNL